MNNSPKCQRFLHSFFRAMGVAALLGASSSALAQSCSDGRWVLTWNDEFNGNSVDGSKWRVEDAALVKNNEKQYYTPQNVGVNGGVLTLLSEKRTIGGRAYASGLVESKDRFSQTYGRFEFRAKLPKTKGLWPALWTLPQSGVWPPEIDVMELLGHDPFTVYMTHHWGTWPSIFNESTPYTGAADFSQAFHTFRCEWFPGRIDYYVDNTLRAQHHINIPSQDFYIIMNTAVGGDWPGDPDASTVFPQRHQIDYVRVYRYVDPPQALVNGGFESANPLLNWTKTGNSSASNQIPRSGNQGGKMYGNFTGSLNTTTMSQQANAAPGQTWRASAWWMNPNWDRMQGTNTATMKVEWLNASSTVIASSTVTALTAASPMDIHTQVKLTGVAPAGTAKARLLMTFTQPANLAGAAYFDDCEFGPITACCADYDGDGFVTGDDFDAYLRAFGIGDFTADFDGDGFVTGDDFDAYVAAFEGGC